MFTLAYKANPDHKTSTFCRVRCVEQASKILELTPAKETELWESLTKFVCV